MAGTDQLNGDDLDRDDRPWRPASSGRAFVYVLPCSGEAILKIGFSRDPLDRFQTLHPRYFEYFDLDAAWLVETDSVREARAIERRLGDCVKDHGAVQPMSVRSQAGGHTEWYRGAEEALASAADDLQRQGMGLHRPARPWLANALEARAGLLFHWSTQMLEAIGGATGENSDVAFNDSTFADPAVARLYWTLRNALDAYAAFALPWRDWVPAPVARWYARQDMRIG